MPSLSPQLAAIMQALSNPGKNLVDVGNAAAKGVSGLANEFQKNMDATGVPQAVGGAAGALGGAIGGAVGGLGNFFDRSLHGKGFDAGSMASDVMNTAGSTAGAGYEIGKAGAEQAPLQGAGSIARTAMAFPPAMSAINDFKSGNVGLKTGLNAGAAALGFYGAQHDPNLTPGGVLDPQLKAIGSALGGGEIPGAMTMHKADYGMLAKALNNVKGQVPDEELQGFLKQLYPNLQGDNSAFDSSRFGDAVDTGKIFRPSSASPSMSRADFNLIADSFKQAVDTGTITPESAWTIYESMLPGLKSANAGFDLSKFENAAGLRAPSVLDAANASDPVLDKSGQPVWLGDKAPANYQSDASGAQPGKWTDAYNRPMLNTGIATEDLPGVAKGSMLSSFTSPDEAAKYGNAKGSAAISMPNLTSAQSGAVAKLIKQFGGFKNGSPTK